MEKFMAYLDKTENVLRQQSAKLAAEDRQDECDLTKVRANVYGICKSVFQMLEKDQACAKLVELHTAWEKALAVAREHDDTKKAVIEQIKLKELNEIKEKLEEMFGA